MLGSSLQSEGADPTILSNDYDPYLFPGRHAPVELAVDMAEVRRGRLCWLVFGALTAPRVLPGPEPHPGAGGEVQERAQGTSRLWQAVIPAPLTHLLCLPAGA